MIRSQLNDREKGRNHSTIRLKIEPKLTVASGNYNGITMEKVLKRLFELIAWLSDYG